MDSSPSENDLIQGLQSFAEKVEGELRSYSVKTLRKRYYGYSDEMFDQLRNLNSRFSNFAGDLVAKLEREHFRKIYQKPQH